MNSQTDVKYGHRLMVYVFSSYIYIVIKWYGMLSLFKAVCL